MKKVLLLATSALLLLAGCAKEEQGLSTLLNGDATTVTFTASMDDGTATKAAADGDGAAASVNRCIMEVYYGDELFTRMYSTVTDKKASFTTQLVANRTYTVAFWADHVESTSALETDLYYTTDADQPNGGLQAIALKGTYAGNNDARDAFFAVKDDCTVAQAGTSFNITLNRPFAQMNVITTDWDKVTTVSSLKPDKVDVTIQNPLTKFNAVTGEASAVDNVTSLNYNADLYTAPAPVQPVSTTEKTLSMDYLFAAATKEVIDIAWKAQKTGNTDVTHSFSTIPYQRNYRTNIKGNLLTSTGQWTVTVDPIWESGSTGADDIVYNVVKDIVDANTVIASEIASGKKEISVKFTEEPNDAGVPGETTGNAILTTNLPEGVKLNILVEAQTKELYIGDYASQTSTEVQTSGTNAAVVNVNIPANSGIKKLVINAPSKTVYVNGIEVDSGVITNLDAITSDNTLIISKDQTVTNLTVRQGALEIHGTVGTAEVIGEHVYVRDCEGLIKTVYDKLKPRIDVDNGYVGELESGKETYRVYQKAKTECVAQIDTTKFYTLNAAVNAATTGQTIELLKSCSAKSTITVDKTVTLDLKTYTLTAACSGYLFDLNAAAEGKTFKITGTDADNCGHIVSNGTSGHKGIAAINGSAITFEMDYVKVHGETEEDAYVGTANANQEALLNDYTSASDIIKLNDCTISTTSVILGGNQEHSAAASLNISGGSYTGAKGFRYAGTEKSVIDGTTITVDQGIALYPYSDTDLKNSFVYDNATENPNHDAISVGGDGSDLVITNTTVQSVSKTAVAAENMGKATISSGTYSSTCTSNYGAALRCDTSGGTIVVNGGTIDGSQALYAVFSNTKLSQYPNAVSTITINGGTIIGGSTDMGGVSGGKAYVEINGGTYTTAVKLIEGTTQWVRINDNAAATFNEKVTSESIVTIPAGTFKKAIVENDLASNSTIFGGTFYEAAPYSGYIKSGYEAKAQGTDPETWKLEKEDPYNKTVSSVSALEQVLSKFNAAEEEVTYTVTLTEGDYSLGGLVINQIQKAKKFIIQGTGTVNLNYSGSGDCIFQVHSTSERAINTSVTFKNLKFNSGTAEYAVKFTQEGNLRYVHDISFDHCDFSNSTKTAVGAPDSGHWATGLTFSYCNLAGGSGYLYNGYGVDYSDASGSKTFLTVDHCNTTTSATKTFINSQNEGSIVISNCDIFTYDDYTVRSNGGNITVTNSKFANSCTDAGGILVFRKSYTPTVSVDADTQFNQTSDNIHDIYCGDNNVTVTITGRENATIGKGQTKLYHDFQ